MPSIRFFIGLLVIVAIDVLLFWSMFPVPKPPLVEQARGTALDAIAINLGIRRRRWLFFRESDKSLRRRTLAIWAPSTRFVRGSAGTCRGH
jgi:hypothetical protein